MQANGNKRILIVDDETAILFAFGQILKAPGVEIDKAASAEEAYDLIAANRYEAAVADLRLSGATNIEGFEVVRRIKETQPACKVIVVTAYGGDDTKKKVQELGADTYIEKPISPQHIKELLRKMGAY